MHNSLSLAGNKHSRAFETKDATLLAEQQFLLQSGLYAEFSPASIYQSGFRLRTSHTKPLFSIPCTGSVKETNGHLATGELPTDHSCTVMKNDCVYHVGLLSWQMDHRRLRSPLPEVIPGHFHPP